MLPVLLLAASAFAASPSPSLDPTSMDRTIDPCVDFYQYSCGGWQKKNPIPGDQTSWSVYGKLEDDNLAYLRRLLEGAAAAKDRDASTQKVGDFYAACMDEAGSDKRGAAPIADQLSAVAGLRSAAGLAPLVARLQLATPGDSMLFGAGSEQDPDDSDSQIAALDQGGLGLPDRDYYLNDDAKAKETRARYLQHVGRVFELLGDAPKAAEQEAATVMSLEVALASASWTRVERRDPYTLKHKMTPADLAKLAPRFDWAAFFKELGAPAISTMNVAAPMFFQRLDGLLAVEPLDAWKTYLRFHVADSNAPFLSKPFVDENFAFYRAYLRGAKELKPRWKRCVQYADSELGEALGRVYVEKAFSPKLKAETVDMTRRIEAAMEERIAALDWMSPETKKQALGKLRAVRNKVGYPDKWRDYSALTIERGDFAANMRRANTFESRRQLAKIGKPVDRDEWDMTPPTVNAYYNPQMNDINFPAGVLQPPLYDASLDDAPNYGDTGGTIGHELTHAFDDEGRQYDAKGNLKDWWTKQDADRFIAQAVCVKDQYGQYVVVDDLKLKSALTLGEDVADLGGEILAYAAWKDAVKGKDLKPVDGLTPEQRFFIGFAQWDCNNTRPEQLREWAITNPHSPGRYRINGVVLNMPEFARAFSCKSGQPMVKPAEKLCRVW